MGERDRKRFRRIQVPEELYRQLDRERRPGEGFGDVLRRLMAQGGDLGTKKGRSLDELIALGKIAGLAWERKLATGEIRVRGRGPSHKRADEKKRPSV